MSQQIQHWETVKNKERLKLIENYEELYRREEIEHVPLVSFETITCPIEKKDKLLELSAQIGASVLLNQIDSKNEFYTDLPLVLSADHQSVRMYFVCQPGHMSDLEKMLDESKQNLINLPERRKAL
ncbi:MAG: hypothetical protein WC069_03610 [Candidatus Shapirobacteria bacterium]